MTCTVADCSRPHHAKGMCKAHWKRARLGRSASAIGGARLPMTRLWSKVNRDGPRQPHMDSACWVWTGSLNDGGYGRMMFDGKRTGTHRVSWTLHFGSIPADMDVLHRCDNPACVNPDHLWLGTLQDNNADREAKGRGAKGEDVGTHILTEEQVHDVLARRAGGSTVRDLSVLFAVSTSAIRSIIKKRRWRHVDAPESEPDTARHLSRLRQCRLCGERGHNRLTCHQRVEPGKTWARGEANAAAKLTEKDVIAIRAQLVAGGVSYGVLAREYGVSRYTIEDVARRRTWRYLPGVA